MYIHALVRRPGRLLLFLLRKLVRARVSHSFASEESFRLGGQRMYNTKEREDPGLVFAFHFFFCPSRSLDSLSPCSNSLFRVDYCFVMVFGVGNFVQVYIAVAQFGNCFFYTYTCCDFFKLSNFIRIVADASHVYRYSGLFDSEQDGM